MAKSKSLTPEVLPAEPEKEELNKKASDSKEVAVPQGGLPATAQPTTTDPLQLYMREAKRYALLTPEQEMELVKRMHEDGDVEAAKRLVQANLRLVVKIAFEYKSMTANVMDLIQEGNIGLMKAVSKFDPTKGARLGYYATWWIRSFILKYILDNFRLVKIGTTQAQKKLFYQLVREKERLEAQGLDAGPKLLAEKLQVKEKEVVEMQTRLSSSGGEVSIDNPLGGEGGATHGELLEAETDSPDDSLAQNQLLGALRDHLPELEGRLNKKEKQVLHERLLAEAPKTLQEVANEYGLSRERVRQIEAGVIKKLRELFEEKGLAR